MTPRAWRRAGTPPLELPALALELAARQAYFRSKAVYDWRSKRRSVPTPQRASIEDVRSGLTEAGVVPGSLLLAHTSITGVTLTGSEAVEPRSLPANVALLHVRSLLDVLTSAVGESGTLAIPTHPRYREDPGYHFHDDKSNLVLRYDPIRTPTHIGLVNEAFRRERGVRRSLHPLQSMSARGPLANELLDGNLFEGALPHGENSSYARIARRNGIVVSIGTPLLPSLTIIHVGEDLRESSWPVTDFFRDRRFIVAADGSEREWRVRERRPLFARAYAEGQLHRDLLAEGILHEGFAGTVRMDWLRSGEMLDYLMFRTERSPYPYMLADLAKRGG